MHDCRFTSAPDSEAIGVITSSIGWCAFKPRLGIVLASFWLRFFLLMLWHIALLIFAGVFKGKSACWLRARNVSFIPATFYDLRNSLARTMNHCKRQCSWCDFSGVMRLVFFTAHATQDVKNTAFPIPTDWLSSISRNLIEEMYRCTPSLDKCPHHIVVQWLRWYMSHYLT